MDKLEKEQNYMLVDASGLAVGLPEGVMGNSEVGHLTIGAGRQEYQVSSLFSFSFLLFFPFSFLLVNFFSKINKW